MALCAFVISPFVLIDSLPFYLKKNHKHNRRPWRRSPSWRPHSRLAGTTTLAAAGVRSRSLASPPRSEPSSTIPSPRRRPLHRRLLLAPRLNYRVEHHLLLSTRPPTHPPLVLPSIFLFPLSVFRFFFLLMTPHHIYNWFFPFFSIWFSNCFPRHIWCLLFWVDDHSRRLGISWVKG